MKCFLINEEFSETCEVPYDYFRYVQSSDLISLRDFFPEATKDVVQVRCKKYNRNSLEIYVT